jgi:hypothetical protein
MLGSSSLSHRGVNPICEQERCGLRTASSSWSSSMRPDSRAPAFDPWQSAPTTCILISLEALPPRTDRSWASTTRAPWGGGRDRGTDAGEPAAGDEKIRFEMMGSQE